MLVDEAVIVEVKSGLTVGLLINFNTRVLKTGIRRIVNGFPDRAPSPAEQLD
jgi:hypothetical protein